MRNTSLAVWVVLICISVSQAGKQKIILKLREPLRAETVRILVPELSNGRGETRDLETRVDLGGQARTEPQVNKDVTLKLNMLVRTVGKTGVQVTLTLPNPGYVEIELLDFYGKKLATILSASLTTGVYPLQPVTFREGDNNGIKFMTLRINGKVVLKKVITKVR